MKNWLVYFRTVVICPIPFIVNLKQWNSPGFGWMIFKGSWKKRVQKNWECDRLEGWCFFVSELCPTKIGWMIFWGMDFGTCLTLKNPHRSVVFLLLNTWHHVHATPQKTKEASAEVHHPFAASSLILRVFSAPRHLTELNPRRLGRPARDDGPIVPWVSFLAGFLEIYVGLKFH